MAEDERKLEKRMEDEGMTGKERAEDEKKLKKRTEDKGMTVEDIRACIIWTLFNCKTLKDYHNVYSKIDILLLSDVFEKFRRMCMTYYHSGIVLYYHSWVGERFTCGPSKLISYVMLGRD